MYLTDQAARRLKERRVIIGLVFMFIVSLVCIALRFYEFRGLKFRWSDNAYASLVWTIIGLHLTYLIMAAGEFFIMGIWAITHRLDPHHAHDITLAGGGWYWIAGTFLVIYLTVYLAPRLV
jgi:heme/copper-type cytochrome/quinol oxidase subunit 3